MRLRKIFPKAKMFDPVTSVVEPDHEEL